ncbi:serine/threonine protein kinase [Anoxybacteroides amylolyticum]|uniref:serine/threonine protein kinase n=1 Tax=Anoxybacteroides amylolyticum TaxID=294699 RepID=UPI00083719E0|nr:serine/threonine-protein kinase [Anoxybacillus amylolyticus]
MCFSYISRFVERLCERRYRSGMMLSGRYEIMRELGMGSYGIAYVAFDKQTNKKVVIKQMRTIRKKQIKESFLREAAILQHLSHPQIPSLYETFLERGVMHLVMEYIDGETVESLIFEAGKMYTEQEALVVLQRVLEIVQFIHEKGIVHRDLRIPNILLKNDRVYIIDFGLARFLGEKTPLIDTYPLEKKLRREIDVKSDIYALGHFLLFLLYSSYQPNTKEECSWEEELNLSEPVRMMLRKMLQIDEPFRDISELMKEIEQMMERWRKDVIVS